MPRPAKQDLTEQFVREVYKRGMLHALTLVQDSAQTLAQNTRNRLDITNAFREFANTTESPFTIPSIQRKIERDQIDTSLPADLLSVINGDE